MEWEIVQHFKNFQPKKSIFGKKNKYRHYAKDFLCFDCETSHNHNEENLDCWVYQWAFYYQENIIIGRYVTDFIECLKKISSLCTNEKQRHIIFIHNLSYDIHYLMPYLFDNFGKENFEIIAVAPHKFITFSISNFEFRCTYKLSNRSLAKWSKDLNVKHKKLSGAIDYDIIRYPFTPLSKKDWKYQIYDILSMKECIEKEMDLENDNILTLPLTSTGYVRRDVKKSYKKNYSKNRKLFEELRLDVNLYKFVKESFLGGYTHANRFIVDITIKAKIRHRDFDSHYPTQQITRKYPMSRFLLYGRDLNIDDFNNISNDYVSILKVTFTNLELKNKKITCPYISENKARKGKREQLKIISDNGRILKCDGIFTLYLTDIDFRIVCNQYKFDYNIDECYVAHADYLPKWFTDVICKYYSQKTNLKIELKKENTIENMINLMKSKNKLNGIYGMTATNPIRDIYKFDDCFDWYKENFTNEEMQEKLNDYYNSKNSFLPYQWSTFTTSYAREELIYLIEKVIGYENFLYCDTDSIFYITNEEIEKKLEEYNNNCLEESKRLGWYITTEYGNKYFHSFDDEKEDILSFRTLHSKCYAYEKMENNKKVLSCTIAGVPQFSNKTTREKELGNIDNLTQGTKFVKCGGTRAKYTENGCVILPTEKTLNNITEHIFDIYEEEI